VTRLARLIDRATGQLRREFTLDGLTPQEIDDWYLSLGRTWDLTKVRLEFNDALEEDS